MKMNNEETAVVPDHAVMNDFSEANILIVDDNPANVALLEAILEDDNLTIWSV